MTIFQWFFLVFNEISELNISFFSKEGVFCKKFHEMGNLDF